jgi:hypothetical protein
MRCVLLVLGAGLAAGALGLLTGCGAPRSAEGDGQAWIEPALRRLARAHPDSVVTVLVRFDGEFDRGLERLLNRAGLQPVEVLGDIIEGRIRAGRIGRVARIEGISYIGKSRTIRISPPPLRPDVGYFDLPR